jgi:tRNA 2-selenouridine synthase
MRSFEEIFLKRIPLIDVRAPIEFREGCFPCSVNLPILTDEERHLVGTCYKQEGKEKAIELGHHLVSGSVKDARVEAWSEFKRSNPETLLYCFRGGLRSRTAVQWLKESGVEIELVSGGYKALRRFLMESTERIVQSHSWFVIGGQTGSGKTELLNEFSDLSLDLEHYANHRGSSFGSRGVQPTQVNFENEIAIRLLELEQGGDKKRSFLIESESKLIGQRMVPLSLQRSVVEAPRIILETPLSERVDRIVKDYIVDAILNDGQRIVRERFERSLLNIQKKLGLVEYRKISLLMRDGFEEDSLDRHSAWVERLLQVYYDPLYEYSLSKVRSQIVLRGSRVECQEFLLKQKILDI